MRDAAYHFNHEHDIKSLYEKALNDVLDDEGYKILSENFVTAKRELVSFTVHTELETSENISYDKENFVYLAEEAGYIHYEKNSLNLLPFLHINKLQTKCFAVVPLKNSTNEILTIPLIKNAVTLKEIQMPVSDETIENIFNAYNNSEGGVMELCAGREPVIGYPEIVTLVYDTSAAVGSEDETGRMDYKNRNFINNVRKGELIATWKPAIEPQPGRSIFAQEIPPKMENPFTYKMGEGLALDKETEEITADIEGILHVSDTNVISVSNTETIPGDVNLKTGNVEVEGNLVIQGSVHPGFTVKASKSIKVEGNVDESTVDAGEDVVIEGGYIGNKNVSLHAKNNIQVNHFQNAKVSCNGDVIVNTYVMNSEINCNGFFKTLDEKKGRVVGGEISAQKGIEVFFAGNKSGGIKTSLIAGVNSEQQEDLVNSKNMIKTLDSNIKKLKQALGKRYFEDPKKFLSSLPGPKLKQVKKVLYQLKEFLNKKKELKQKVTHLEMLTNENKHSAITIYKESYENVFLKLMTTSMELKSTKSSPTRYFFNDETKDIQPGSVKEKDS